ncbi:hypothetical protein GCM10010910_29380 [Microbacterium nanhaiense]|uniref:Ribosomally synthesized peptide with SipW-like signal peptide n=1 Tax=Microbacterium nanhaiense TaxID=1301026 RepID=A0ABQ2N560_9MICO|nr:hypothetical protein [Microbacterium nanhaiense]GGO67488.1 hypothetical protein GCM10010910_29380 [Microbacterium nanhaiense]
MTENTTQDTLRSTREHRHGNRRPILAFALAALAVGGIGAAITSAAWTDNAFFSAPAGAATFNLQGSLDGTTWSESDDPGSVELVVPASALADLLPGETRTVDLWVRNEGSVNAALTSEVSFTSTATFVDAPSVAVNDLVSSLTSVGGSASSDHFELTVTTPSDWSAANQGAEGTVIITIAGTATA